MTNKKEYMIILFLHLPPLVLTQSRVRTWLAICGGLYMINGIFSNFAAFISS